MRYIHHCMHSCGALVTPVCTSGHPSTHFQREGCHFMSHGRSGLDWWAPAAASPGAGRNIKEAFAFDFCESVDIF